MHMGTFPAMETYRGLTIHLALTTPAPCHLISLAAAGTNTVMFAPVTSHVHCHHPLWKFKGDTPLT